MKLVNIGFGNLVNASRVIAVVSPDSAPVKRMRSDSRDRGMLIDASHGRKTHSVILTDSDHVILSYLQPERIEAKFNEPETEGENDE